MDRGQAKRFLLRYRKCVEQIQKLETEIEEVLTTATHRTANPDEYNKSNCYGDKVGNGAATLATLSERIAAAKVKRLRAEMKIFFVIDKVQDGDVAEVLARHYLELETLANIAGIMALTERWVLVLHKRGLDEVARILDERSANG